MRGFNNMRRQVGIKGNLVVPVDTIWFFNDTSVPDGFSRYTASDGRRIVSAGSTYACAEDAGANTITISAETSDSYNHNDSSNCEGNATPKDNGEEGTIVGDTAVTHSHDYSKAESALEPASQGLLLIKATRRHQILPANVLAMWDDTGSNPAGLTQQYTASDGTLLRAQSSIAANDGTTTVTGASTTTDGAHRHATLGVVLGGGENRCPNSAGDHSHSPDLDFTFAFKKVYMGLWTHATATYALESGMICWQNLEQRYYLNRHCFLRGGSVQVYS